MILARFESGASATLEVRAVCWEGTPFGQIHELDRWQPHDSERLDRQSFETVHHPTASETR